MSPTFSAICRDPEHDAYAALATAESDEANVRKRIEPAWIDEQAMAPVQCGQAIKMKGSTENSENSSWVNFNCVLGFLLLCLAAYLIFVG